MCGFSVAVTMLAASMNTTLASDPITNNPFKNLSFALDKSLDRIQHRGPDGRGTWISDDGNIGV